MVVLEDVVVPLEDMVVEERKAEQLEKEHLIKDRML